MNPRRSPRAYFGKEPAVRYFGRQDDLATAVLAQCDEAVGFVIDLVKIDVEFWRKLLKTRLLS
ncbi:hypothetical protein B0E49_04325 [Polaromonas sp. C04]|nr:hypothetical protein B0E49_04325 [Polaromonas sp. C04]